MKTKTHFAFRIAGTTRATVSSSMLPGRMKVAVPSGHGALADGAHHAEAGCPRRARQRGMVGALISRASDAVLPKQPLETPLPPDGHCT
jgi:hypothetical protein